MMILPTWRMGAGLVVENVGGGRDGGGIRGRGGIRWRGLMGRARAMRVDEP